MQPIYKNSSGLTISMALKNNGTPINLTGMTVTLNLYQVGTNTLQWSHAATVDTALSGLAHYTTVSTDFNTVGDFYSTIVVIDTLTAGTAFSMTFVDQIYEVIENQQSLVTVPQLLEFMDIPTENAKPSNTIQTYINMANTSLDLRVPSLANTSNQKMIEQKQRLIMIKAATLYFMNSGENNINPEIRTLKIKLWTEEYNSVTESLNNSISTVSTSGNGAVRRVINTSQSVSALNQAPPAYTSTYGQEITYKTFPQHTSTAPGSQCTGIDGALNRRLNLNNTLEILTGGILIFRNGSFIDATQCTIVTTINGYIVFTGINIFNDDTITCTYTTST